MTEGIRPSQRLSLKEVPKQPSITAEDLRIQSETRNLIKKGIMQESQPSSKIVTEEMTRNSKLKIAANS